MSRSAYASTTIVKVKDGMVGEHGVNSVIVHLYKRSMDVPSIPSNTLTYNFETGILSGDLENWSQNYDELKKLYESELNSIIDSNNNEVTLEENNHIYMITAMATSIEDTYDINFSKWTSPLVISQSNFNQTVIYLYQRTNQLPSLPGSIKYNFATGQITGELGNWSTSINSSDNGAPCYVTSACAVGHGVSCEVSNWSGITILVEDGKSPTVTKEGNVTTITDASGQTVIIEDGSVITRILPIYYFAPLNASAPAQPNMDTVIYNTDEPKKWTTLIPTYTTGGTYYTCTMTEFKTGDSPIFSDVTVDYAKTSQSLEIAGLEAKAKYFIHNSDGSYVIQGLENFDENNINTYGFNALMAPGGIKLSYNALNLLTLGNQSLAIKTPPQDSTTEGKTAMLLTGNSLTFYEPGTTTEASILDGSGLTLKKGGIISGTPEQNAYIYISTEDYGTALTIANQTSSLWRMIIGQNFGVTKNGGVYASSGKIGGWNLTSNKLYYNTDTPGLYGDTVVLSAEPYGTASSEVIANHVANGTSNRWRFSIGDNFGITADGTLYATNAEIDGHLRTTSGTIGNWEIESSDGIYGGALYTREFGEDGGIYITPGFKTSLSSHLKGSVYERAVPAPTFETWDNGRIYYIYSNGKYISQYGIPFDENKVYYTTSEITDSDYNVIDLTSFELHNKDWFLIAGRKFGITTDGILYAQDAQIKGDIYATSLTLARGALKVTDIEGMPDVNFLVQKDGIILSNDGKTSFSVSSEGKLAANSAEIKGTIYARAGEIGGWNIGTDENRSLFYGSEIPGATTNNLVLSKSSEQNNTAIAGSAIGLNWFISAGRNFGVTTGGVLYANNATITGVVNATTGTFGNASKKITVGTGTSGNSAIRYGMTQLSDTSSGFYIGTDGIALGGGKFKVTASGVLTASSATLTNSTFTSASVSGAITATSFSAYGGASYPRVTVDSNGLTVYDGSGNYNILARFSDNILMSNNSGAMSINASGININTAGTATQAFRFNNLPIISVQRLAYTSTSAIASGKTWDLTGSIGSDITNNYSVLGILGYNFDANTSGGISVMNVYELWLSTTSSGPQIRMKARNLGKNSRPKGLKIIIDLLVTPKNSAYNAPSDIIDGGQEGDDDTGGGDSGGSSKLPVITTAQTYGPTDSANIVNQFTMPYITIDEYGRVTSGGTRTLTINSKSIRVNDNAGNGNAIDFYGYETSGDAKTHKHRAATVKLVETKHSSDIRLKENISNLSDKKEPLIKLYDSLQPIQFTYKHGVLDDVEKIRTKYGFAAQAVEQSITKASLNSCGLVYELEPIPNSLVEQMTNGESYKILDYDSFHALHVLYAQNLEKRITQLEEEIKQLKQNCS